MKRQTAFVAIALLSLFLTVTFPASALGQERSAPTASTTTRVSVASNGTQGNDFSGDSSISASGRFVAFDSPATNLVSGDTNSVPDIFVHDRKTGQTTRVSVASDGTQGNCNSDFPSLSANGRYVAFDSCADNLVSGDSNGFVDTFVHDRATGQTTLVSVASDGTQGNDSSSSHVSISADGRYVAFQSFASNLVSGDTNNTLDVFVHDRETEQTTRVSVRSNGTQGNSLSAHPSLSANGRYVTFASFANNLVSGDTNGAEDVFVHDRKTGRTTLVSVASDGTQGNGESAFPSISANGRYVAFFSLASNLVSGDTNFASDIFVHDRQTGRTTRVSVASDGTQANDGCGVLSISANGRYVAFESVASNLVSGDTNNSQDIFVHDRQTGQTTRVTVASNGTQGNGNSFDPYPSSISADGRYVAFESVASNLVSSDTNGVTDIFVHDRQGGGSVEDPLPAEPEGFHESHFEGNQNQFTCFAVGWAADPDDRNIDLNVRVLSDGVEVAQTVAGTFREGLEEAGACPGGTCFFSVDLWGLISPDEDHLITVQAQDAQTGEWVNLSDTPRTLNCSEVNVLPEGFHDAIEGVQNPFSCFAEGWAADPNDRDIDLNVRILSDGVEVAQTVAGTFRQDLEDAGVCTGGTCSFSVNLWSLISLDTDHSIAVQAQDAQSGEWVDLSNTPKTLNCIDPGAQPIVWDGFSNGNNGSIEALEIFNDNLYAEATNYVEGATIWRSVDGATWTQVTSPGFDGAYGANNPIVFDMFTFEGKLYAGTGNWESTPSAGQIWRSADGIDWNLVASNGLGNPNNTGFTTFTSFKGMLYAAALNGIDGVEIWRSSTGNSGSWQPVASQGFGGGSAYFIITSLTAFKGQLYAGVEATAGTGAQVWRSSNGTNWTLASDNGFGDTDNFQTGGSVVYRGQLYMTTRNDVTGAQLWRSSNGSTWVQVVGNGFGDINNLKIESLTTYANALHAAANNPVTGVELWRSTDGVNWTQINSDGFGDGSIFSGLWSNGTIVFNGNYLIGSTGPFGGVIWQLQR